MTEAYNLAERIEQQVKVIEGGNHAIYMYNCSEVQSLLTRLDFDDLLPEEVITIHYTLAQAYGRKLSGGSPALLRLVTQSADRPKHIAG